MTIYVANLVKVFHKTVILSKDYRRLHIYDVRLTACRGMAIIYYVLIDCQPYISISP